MFDGMRAGDSSMVHSVMKDDVIFQRVTQNREGKAVVQTSSFQNFLNAVGTPHDKVWDEQIEFGTISIDGDLASAWTPFKFYLGGVFRTAVSIPSSFTVQKMAGRYSIW